MGKFLGYEHTEYMKAMGFDLPCPLIAADDGFDQINIAYWTLVDGKLAIAEDKIKSRAKRGRHAMSLSLNSIGLYATGEDVYTVKDTMDYEDTRTEDYPKKPLNRFLVHAALNKIGISDDMPVALITGLPLKVYMPQPGQVNTKLINAKKENMMQPVTVGINNLPSAKIVFHGVFPEAIAGIADYLIDDQGQPREGRDPNIARMAMDIGGKTTDMAIILPGNEVAVMETINFGVSNMRDRLKEIIQNKLEMTLDSITLDEALETKKAHIFGELHNFTEEWDLAVNNVLRDIFEAANEMRKGYPSLRELVCMGGGAALCEENIKKNFPNVQIVENPDGANARGYLKFATRESLEMIRSALEAVQSELNVPEIVA